MTLILTPNTGARERILSIGGSGCLAADTVIHLNRGGKGFRTTIENLVKMENGGAASNGHRWDPSIPTRVARAVGESIMLGDLAQAWSSGIKETFTLRTVGGREIRGTAIHPFLKADGEWVVLGDIQPSDLLQVNDGRGTAGRGKKPYYLTRETRFHPSQVTSSSGGRVRANVPTHRLVVEAKMNNLPLDEFLDVLRDDETRVKGMIFLDTTLHVHHIDHNPQNNALDNLAVLTEEAHHRLHAAEGNTANVLWKVGVDEVESVEKFGLEPTYDIEVADDPHNFIANGFVVHNSGKTHDWLTVANSYAEAARAGQPIGKFYVVDTDYTVERSMESYPGVEEVVDYGVTPEWQDWVARIEQINKKATRQDWVVIDMASPLWEMAQEYYIERIFKKDSDEFYLMAREQNKKGGAMDGYRDWGVINKLYRQNVANHLMRCQANLYATAAATPLNSDTDSKEMKAIYARHGIKPVGQKHLSHQFHTVLWKQAPKVDEWTLTTIKDRSRVSLVSEPVRDFVDGYLVGVAGWGRADSESAADKAQRLAAQKAEILARMSAAKG